MATAELPIELDIDGAGAPPRSNGALAFSEPWESRVFGQAMALYEAGVFEWDEFRVELIASITRWELAHPDGVGYRYYRCWFEALEKVLADRELVPSASLDERTETLARRPAGHDHDHDDHRH